MKTEIRVLYSIIGASALGNVMRNRNTALDAALDDLEQQLAACTPIPAPLIWQTPYPTPDEYVTAITAHAIRTVIPTALAKISSLLDTHEAKALEHLHAAMPSDQANINVASTLYDVIFRGPSVCIPCGDMLHKIDAFVAVKQNESLSLKTISFTVSDQREMVLQYHIEIVVLFELIK